jgi:hypothetical protein
MLNVKFLAMFPTHFHNGETLSGLYTLLKSE